MNNDSLDVSNKDRRISVAVLFVSVLLLFFFTGCVANDVNAMPWAAPDPNDGSINFPGMMAP